MTTPESQGARSDWQLPIIDTPGEVATLRSAGFHLLLEAGKPVTKEQWAERSGIEKGRIEEIIESPALRGRIEVDDQGRLLGITGLTITPTPHQIDIEGETRWTWCALDAVGILGALHATGTIHSTDPHSGAAIEITVENGTPAGDTSLFILDGYGSDNVRQDWCPRVNFFANRDDADNWVAANHLEGKIVTVADVAAGAAAMWQTVVESTRPN